MTFFNTITRVHIHHYLLVVGIFISISVNAQQPQLLKDIHPQEHSFPNNYTAFDGQMFFVADEGIHGWELWVSDGTEAGTHLFKDINPGPTGSNPSFFMVHNNKLYFNADDGVHATELWVTDGTEEGTYMVKDINTSGDGSDYHPTRGHIVYNGRLYFKAQDGIHGYEYWVTDGTEEGTYMIKDINPDGPYTPVSDRPSDLTEYNGKLYFYATDGTHGKELWVTDGTEEGTYMVKDINPGPEDSTPFYFVIYEDKLYFRGDDGVHGRELWVTDGTESGTQMVKDINPGTTGSALGALINFNGMVYFYAWDENENVDLWKSDGTEAGTQALGVNGLSNTPHNFTRFDGKLYFSAGNGEVGGRRLWVTDGTAEGTHIFDPIIPYPSEFTIYDGKLYLKSDNDIWVTDGTEAGTHAIIPEGADIPDTGDPSLQTHSLVVCNDVLYYTACYFWEYGCEPYYIDSSLHITETETGTFNYWPNPFSDRVHIQTDQVVEKIVLLSITGNTVETFSPESKKTTLPLSHLSEGIYFMQVHTGNNVETVKLIKRP